MNCVVTIMGALLVIVTTQGAIPVATRPATYVTGSSEATATQEESQGKVDLGLDPYNYGNELCPGLGLYGKYCKAFLVSHRQLIVSPFPFPKKNSCLLAYEATAS